MPNSYENQYYALTRDERRWNTFPCRELVLFLKSLPADASILEIGCGTGELLHYLPHRTTYVGVERSSYALDAAEKQWRDTRPHARFIADDPAALPFRDGMFDAVLLIFSLEHLDRPREVLRECIRLLKPGGALAILAPNLEFPLAYPNALRHRSHAYRFWFAVLRTGDYVRRLFGADSFRTIPEHFTAHTGRYEKKDDDLSHVVSSWEVVSWCARAGLKLETFWQPDTPLGWRRFARLLPTLRYFGTPLAAVFRSARSAG